MAQVVSGGPPVNEPERRVIRFLRDHAPDDWIVIHNVEVPLRGASYEIDVIVVTGHAVALIDVKHVRGRVEVAQGRWFPAGRTPYHSPVQKIRAHARSFQGQLSGAARGLNKVFVDSLVVLTADTVLIDHALGDHAEAGDCVSLEDLIPLLGDVSRVRHGKTRDITAHRAEILKAVTGVVRVPTVPLRFGNWEVVDKLGGTDEVAEYRAINTVHGSDHTALLRVYQTDPFAPEAQREAERIAVSNAFNALWKLPPSGFVVQAKEMFPTEEEDRWVLVLEDLRGRSLHLVMNDRRDPPGTDEKYRIILNVLQGLAAAHAGGVVHRALSPSAVFVTDGGPAKLIGFDYARPEGNRQQTVRQRLVEILDQAYVAPECQNGRAEAMSRRSDVYAAGIIAFRLLTGELPFATSVEQYEKQSVLPRQFMLDAGVPEDVAELLQRLCAFAEADRPTASQAANRLRRALDGGSSSRPRPVRPAEGPNYRDLPAGFQLTENYVIRDKLGSGTFGTVYLAYDSFADLNRAVKVITNDASPIDRAQQEFQILLNLPQHPNVVQVIFGGYLAGGVIPYIAFEYLDGQDVQKLIDSGPLGAADTRHLGIDLLNGLAHLHANAVYHCDIKPSNLLRTDKGCKILDLNVSVRADSSFSRAGGSARYLPPDYSTSGTPTGADLEDRDVYAAGLVLYQVLTGRWPFPSPRPVLGEEPIAPEEQGVVGLAPEFTAVLMKAVSPKRSDRFATAAEFRTALQTVADVHERKPRPALPDPVPVATDGEHNPFVGHLKTLYSQSSSSNAGTRGNDDPYKLYIPTRMDEALLPAIREGVYRLVVITGNAGDGKTAFLEKAVEEAEKRGGVRGPARENGADLQLPGGTWLRTNHDGSQDEGDKVNDEVLLDFFGPYAGAEQPPDNGEIRLIAINEGRLVDFLTDHEQEFSWLRTAVENGLRGRQVSGGIAVVNLNRRSVVADQTGHDEAIFDLVLRRMTHERFWEDCGTCSLADTCYARHNAQTFAHPGVGPKVMQRLKELYRMTHLRGRLHITMRDLRSALAYTLTSGRDCAEIHELYRSDHTEKVLGGFYFNSWAGTPGTRDRLLALLREVDIAAVPEPALDRKLDYVGPDAGQAVMTVDGRGDTDLEILGRLWAELPRGTRPTLAQARSHADYLAAARRRFYFECVDDDRSAGLLPYRSAKTYLDLLAQRDSVPGVLRPVVEAINRGEGLPDPQSLGDFLALQIRAVPGGTIRSYRTFPLASLSLAASGGDSSPYLEEQPDGLVLRYHGEQGHTARLEIRLDLFELLYRLREGHLPGIAEEQGLLLGLTIFKNALSAAPYQSILLTTGGTDLRSITRTGDGTLVMKLENGDTGDAA